MFIKTSRKAGGRTLESRSLTEEFVAKELTRRQMVQAVMLGTVGTWLGAAGLAGCGSSETTTSGTATPAPTGTGDPADPNATPPTTKHLVGMGYDETDRNKALQAALAETIGLGMIKPGESVYLRVNSNSGDVYPYSTSPDTILAVGGMLKDLGVTDIRIGDRSFFGDTGTAANLVSNGITGAALARSSVAGSSKQKRASQRTRVAKPPCRPTQVRSLPPVQRCSRPERHAGQTPHAPHCQPIPTTVPSARPASSPARTTRPTISWPGTSGLATSPQSPSSRCTSLWQTEQLITSTSTSWPAGGGGSASTTGWRGVRGAVCARAWMLTTSALSAFGGRKACDSAPPHM
jgi:hypothetical protein